MSYNPRIAAAFFYEFCNATGLPSFKERERAGLAELDDMTDAELTSEVTRFNELVDQHMHISNETIASLKRAIRKEMDRVEKSS